MNLKKFAFAADSDTNPGLLILRLFLGLARLPLIADPGAVGYALVEAELFKLSLDYFSARFDYFHILHLPR